MEQAIEQTIDQAVAKEVSVLFVCMGNICRSPTAEGVFRKYLAEAGLEERVGVDSAGTHAYHVGEPPDPRAQSAAALREVDLSTQRARKAAALDFERFDYIVAMDRENLTNLEAICPQGQEHKLRLLMQYAEHFATEDVPDPYYGGAAGFDRVLDMIEAASAELLQEIRSKHF